MSKEYKEMFIRSAEIIPNYKSIDQIELAEKYLEGGELKDSYLAALIVRYWNIIDRNVFKDHGLYDVGEAYDWYVNAILCVLELQSWKDPKSTMYNDPRAIEKMLNVCVSCDRANWFQASNRLKRKINHGTTSLDYLQDTFNDAYVTPDLIVEEEQFSTCQELVLYCFNNQQYLMALLVDVIVHDIDVDSISDDVSLCSKIRKSIKNLPSNYSSIFAENYGLDADKVDKSFEFIYNMDDKRLKQIIEVYVFKLRRVLRKGV